MTRTQIQLAVVLGIQAKVERHVDQPFDAHASLILDGLLALEESLPDAVAAEARTWRAAALAPG